MLLAELLNLLDDNANAEISAEFIARPQEDCISSYVLPLYRKASVSAIRRALTTDKYINSLTVDKVIAEDYEVFRIYINEKIELKIISGETND